MPPGAYGNAHASYGRDAAVLDHEVVHLDGGGAWRREGGGSRHSPAGRVARFATAKRRVRASATASVWRSAIAAVCSVLVEDHDSTMAGVITLGLGPMNRAAGPSLRRPAVKT